MAASDPMALAERRLGWLDRRQQVLARNVAHADTPGYRARDMTPFAEMLRRAGGAGQGMVRTDARHLGPAGRDAAAKVDRAAEVSPDGNAVSLDDQAIRIAETEQAHALTFGLYRRWSGMVRSALGRAG